MIRFSNSEDFFELAVIDIENNPNVSGDARVSLSVHSSGFSATNDLWIDAPELQAFCIALVQLEQARNGQATLHSISPRELSLTIQSVSSLGHLALSGATGYEVHGAHRSFKHQLTFGFEFDPSQIAEAVREKWVCDYAT